MIAVAFSVGIYGSANASRLLTALLRLKQTVIVRKPGRSLPEWLANICPAWSRGSALSLSWDETEKPERDVRALIFSVSADADKW